MRPFSVLEFKPDIRVNLPLLNGHIGLLSKLDPEEFVKH
jgi:hypothetical protein